MEITDQLITGEWQGYFQYGEGYPLHLRLKKHSFCAILQSLGGKVAGTCEDNEMEKSVKRKASIEGGFTGDVLTFVKRYPFLVAFDPSFKLSIASNELAPDINYTGKIKKKLFSRKPYFTGDWLIHDVYVDDNGQLVTSVGKGRWRMRKRS